MTPTGILRAAAAVVIAAVAAPQTISAQVPSAQDLAEMTASGSYLAARHAGQTRDAVAAAAYYRSAVRHDPGNPELVERAFLSLLIGGDVEESTKLADRILRTKKDDRVARLVVGIRNIKQKKYDLARRNVAQSVRGPITDLAATLLSAWAQHGAGDTKGAVAAIERLQGPDWYAIFKSLHTGLILDLAGRSKDAGEHFERAHKLDASALRVVEAYGGWLSRNGRRSDAVAVFEGFAKVLPNHPLTRRSLDRLKAGEKLPLLVASPQLGAAESLYGLGASLGRRGGEDLGLVYLQLAIYLAPTHPLALLSLADLYESIKKPELAIKVYERVPADSPLRRNAAIQLAANLESLDRPDEAKKHLRELIAQRPDDIEAIVGLGNVLRARKEFAECAETYSRAVDLVPNPTRANWLLYYFRGICFERAKQWPKAEADLRKALELFPEQPHVLNYLGYSWIDQGVNLPEGMKMIERAVAARPDDGYIVDSLGWAHYRLGNYEEAVKQLERAIELKPQDPTINDHLGDAYWKVGRKLEATFQWSHARDLKPEPEDMPKILEKLKSGLPDGASPQAKADKKDNGG